MKKFTLITILFFCLPVLLFSQTADEILTKGNTAYQRGDYDTAINDYLEVINQDYSSVNLYYNLGNAYYKKGLLGNAILFYEKASKLDPNDEDILHNLKIARVHTVDQINDVPKLFIVEWWNVLITLLTTEGWAYLVLFIYIILLGSFLFYRFTSNYNLRKLSIVTGFTSLAVFIAVLVLLASNIKYENESNYGVLLDSSVTVKITPDKESNDAFLIHEGVKFKLEDKVNDWVKIRLADGKVGWLPDNTFGAI